MHGGDQVADVLSAQGVHALFTLCGGHISPILVGAKARGIRIVDTRHEATAVFAADAVARLTGRPGVAAVTAGPGLTNTVTAVKNAQLAQSPVVLLGGAAPTVLQGRGALQDIDQMALLRPHVKWSYAVRRVRDIGPAVEEAFRSALSGVPGPVFVELPIDLLYDEVVVRQWYGAARSGRSLGERAVQAYLKARVARMFSGAGRNRPGPAVDVPAPVPAPDRVAAAAAALAKATRPVILVGSQAMVAPGAADRLVPALERIGAPVFLSGTARGLLGADHPLQARHKRRESLKAADLVVLAGVPADFRLDYGNHVRRGATLVSANRSSGDLRRNRRPDVAILGDAALALAGVAAALPARDDDAAPSRWPEWMDVVRGRDAEREADIATQAEAGTDDGVGPVRMCVEVAAALPAGAIIVGDGGDIVATASYVLRPDGPLRWLDPGVFGTLGVGAGFALGAATVHPDAPLWIVFGDGSVGYSLSEFDTFVRHGIGVVAVVGNDASWSQIAREQVELLRDDVATVLAPTRYDQVAAGFGAVGLHVDDAAELPAALAKAKAADGPVLVDVRLGRSDFRKGSISM
ncbi:thiamine pyrophosphate-binding protein [Pseudonocardia dioxanivorans]|uniref:Acetolactate synthase n=1 Tax=Pseudonocardia dioxanivorans (strain ATCC 55486 / DSM 44775 / JCM 13855 / CB1190) TaxID=675635 RepID=F4CQY9_PSEUX|nr:thiamine pyrophosphate-binding protein [Pseudonocardia dioxanivorans]AEA23688.1 Acetolactate synthase [Pseudonocardia dioxanivorans CB1190]